MGKFDGRVAVITGAARGQGREHALALGAEGASIVAADIQAQISQVPYPMSTPDDLADTVRAVEQQGAKCLPVIADVRDPAAMSRVASAAVETFGRIDILVANAGIWTAAPIVETPYDNWCAVMEVNLYGTFNAIKACAPQMIEQKYGRIVATSSVLGRQGQANIAAYVASKWGIIGLVKTAAKELGPHQITVNAICPGFMDTAMNNNDAMRALWNPELESPTDADIDRKIIESGLHALPFPRLHPRESARAVAFLASEDAAYITGSAINVDAGWSANYTA